MRLRVQLNFVVDFTDGIPEMSSDLNDGFEGAVFGLYPSVKDAMIEPNGKVTITRLKPLNKVVGSDVTSKDAPHE